MSLSELERLITSPLDPEFEAWRAIQRGYALKDGQIGRIIKPRPAYSRRHGERGSFLTGTSAETIYSNPSVGTAKATFTSEFQISDTAGMGPQPVLPPYFFLPSRGTAQCLRLIARGIRSDVVTTPTWQFFTRFNNAAAIITGPNVGSMAATTISATGATNLLWEVEQDVQMVTLGAAGANSTLRGLGFATFEASTTPTSLSIQIFGGGASPGTVATYDISTTTYITFSAACGTSSGSNSVQLLQWIIMGLN